MASVTLSYRVKLQITRVKSDLLYLLAGLFSRLHADATTQLGDMNIPRQPFAKGQFAERAARRATVDFMRAKKAARKTRRLFKLPYLHAELIDAAEIQEPRKAKGFDLWFLVQGAGLYLPAKKHRALNKALSFPGAEIGKRAIIFRKNGKWYAQVPVIIPCPEPYKAKGWVGCDIGVRAAVTRSDGYKGPDLRPILKKQRDKREMHQKQGIDRPLGQMTPQRQLLSKEAKAVVSVAQRSGRGVAVEDPKRLLRYKQHAARFFGNRVLLLASLVGVPVRSVAPPYTSTTCSHCGSAKTFRYRCMFRCLGCGFTHNADFNASCVIRYRASELPSVSHAHLSLSPGGGEAR